MNHAILNVARCETIADIEKDARDLLRRLDLHGAIEAAALMSSTVDVISRAVSGQIPEPEATGPASASVIRMPRVRA